jgi:hypothetical protein
MYCHVLADVCMNMYGCMHERVHGRRHSIASCHTADVNLHKLGATHGLNIHPADLASEAAWGGRPAMCMCHMLSQPAAATSPQKSTKALRTTLLLLTLPRNNSCHQNWHIGATHTTQDRPTRMQVGYTALHAQDLSQPSVL